MDLLIQKADDKKLEKRIFLLTDASSPVLENDLELVIEQFKKMKCKIHCVSLSKFELNQRKEQKALSKIRKKNEKLLKELVEKVNGLIVNIEEAIQLMSYFRSKSVMKRPTFKGEFSIGCSDQSISLSISSYLKTKSTSFPTSKKLSLHSYQLDSSSQKEKKPNTSNSSKRKQAKKGKKERKGEDQEQEDEEISEEEQEEEEEEEETKEYLVKMDRKYECILDPEIKLERSNLSKGYKYGRSLIPFDSMDDHVLEYKSGEKGMKLIGFCDMNAVPREHFMDNCEVIVGNDESSEQAISGLVQAMIETKSLAIVRFVKRKNAKVLLGVLIPISKNTQHFIFNKLPFSEDLRHYNFTPLDPISTKKNFKPSTQQIECTKNLILSLDLEQAQLDDSQETQFDPLSLLKPKYTFNPTLQHFYQCLQSRALYNFNLRDEKEKSDPLFSSVDSFLSNKRSQISSLDPIISNYINPSPFLFEKNAQTIHSFRDSFVLTNLSNNNNKSKKRTFWSEMFAENLQKQNPLISYLDSSDSKKLKSNDDRQDQLFSISNILSGGVDKVSSINPIQDFEKMMKRRDIDLVDSAIQQMQKVIFQIVDDSLGNQFYQKAIDSILSLRKGCIEEEESSQFNAFILQCKQFYQNKRKNDFFVLMQKNSIYPISSEESDDSNFSPSQATSFYEKQQQENSLVIENNNQDENDEIDDLWNKIE